MLLTRFQDPRYYPSLPADARKFYVAGAHFVRGSFGILRADGRGALESADALDRMGLKLYSMIASQLRCLYYTMRGDFAKAVRPPRAGRAPRRAHRVGLAGRDLGGRGALLLVYPQIGDVVGSARLAHRLERLGKTVPSLKRYAALARDGILLTRGDAGEPAGDRPGRRRIRGARAA